MEKIKVPAGAEKGEYIRAYKQSKRKDDDIAIVTSAQRVKLSDDYRVENISLIFGGMAPTTVSAKNAEDMLIGKSWTDPATIECAMTALEQEFDLPSSVPGGMPTYRKTLALSFFYKFYHDVLSQLNADISVTADREAIDEIERSVSKGSRDYGAAVAYEKKVVGK
ncbi:hypothetical protein KEM54_004930, partial [Ascosphaera aggregata]